MSQTREEFMAEIRQESKRRGRDDLNSLAYWLPRIEAAGLPTPTTRLVSAPEDIMGLLDGEPPAGWKAFTISLAGAGDDVGWPCFMRTGHVSGKHQWADTCYVNGPFDIPRHVARLVEECAMAGFMGVPCDVFAVRQMIPTEPLCVCEAYRGFPVVREFRFFADESGVTHVQPYWPPQAVEDGEPDREDWRELLAAASTLTHHEERALGSMAISAAAACEGEWSVDFLQAADGDWWLTDMASGPDSFRWDA